MSSSASCEKSSFCILATGAKFNTVASADLNPTSSRNQPIGLVFIQQTLCWSIWLTCFEVTPLGQSSLKVSKMFAFAREPGRVCLLQPEKVWLEACDKSCAEKAASLFCFQLGRSSLGERWWTQWGINAHKHTCDGCFLPRRLGEEPADRNPLIWVNFFRWGGLDRLPFLWTLLFLSAPPWEDEERDEGGKKRETLVFTEKVWLLKMSRFQRFERHVWTQSVLIVAASCSD